MTLLPFQNDIASPKMRPLRKITFRLLRDLIRPRQMHFGALSLLFVIALNASTVFASTTNIYHNGWIDLNKNGKEDPYENPSNSVDQRVRNLLSQMTLMEKIGQLCQAFYEPKRDAEFTAEIRQGGLSSFIDAGELLEHVAQRNRLQRFAVEDSRLGVPLIFGHDSIHGFRTVFPIPLALSCAWEPKVFEKVSSFSARESSAAGVNWAFAPMVDLARDPRWGRIAEGFGEDPWLGSLYSAACVRGFQGTNVAAPDKIVACLKHYVGYGAAEGGRDYNTTDISDYTLWNYYLPQFKAGVDAGALTVMSAFNCLSGFPASANRHTLTDILRKQLKFPGFVVSDWTSIAELIPHGVAANDAEAARLAINAGVDMEMVSTTYCDTLPRQIQEGKIPASTVDQATRRVLRVKFLKGLFDHPYTDETLQKSAFLRPDAVALAREAAVKSCVLLKNESHALPLSHDVQSIALIGPLADAPAEMLGTWSGPGRAEDAVSLAAALRARLGHHAKLTVVRGCGLPGMAAIKNNDGTANQPTNASDNDEIEQAVAAAKASETVVLALGEPASWSGENSSRSHLTLPGHQRELFNAVVAVGKPVIVVLFNGRPLAIPQLEDKATAILEAWDPGVQAGNAVTDLLFGDASPSGRLTASWPRSIGQVPVYYNHFNTGRPDKGKYVDGPRTPLFPFGFGLTYTKFSYGKMELSAPSMKIGGELTARIHVKNIGSCPGTEVVQLYLRDLAASAGPCPVRELKGFKKVHLSPGEDRTVAFKITDRKLGYYDAQGHWLVEPGRFELWIAKDAISGQSQEFKLTGQ